MFLAIGLSFWFAIMVLPDGTVLTKGTQDRPVVYSSEADCTTAINKERATIKEKAPEVVEGVDFVLLCVQDEKAEQKAHKDRT